MGIVSPNMRIKSVIKIKIVKSFELALVFKTKVRIELRAMLTKLFPIKIVIRNVSGFFANSFAILAVKDFCDFISSFILFALINAISLAEKKKQTVKVI